MPQGILPNYSPIASGFAQDYRNAGRIGNIVAPMVEHPETGGQIIQFSNDTTYLDGGRGENGTVKQWSQGYKGLPFTMSDFDLDFVKDENQYTNGLSQGFDWAMRAAVSNMEKATLDHEMRVATLYTTAANYITGVTTQTLAGTDQFSDPASSPRTIIDEAREAILTESGQRPNVIFGGFSAMRGLRRNHEVLAQYHQSNSQTISLDQVAEFAEVSLALEAEAVVSTFATPGSRGFVFGKDIILAYLPEDIISTVQGGGTPGPIPYSVNQQIDVYTAASAFTYCLPGHPLALAQEYDRATRSYVWGIKLTSAVVPTGVNDAGKFISAYLIKNAVA
jgi:hypothetical protein